MKTLQQKIEVMQACANGEKIECTAVGYSSWDTVDNPVWDWTSTDYRVAKPEPKKIKFLAYIIAHQLGWVKDGEAIIPSWIRIPSEDKEITLP